MSDFQLKKSNASIVAQNTQNPTYPIIPFVLIYIEAIYKQENNIKNNPA